MGPSIHQYIGCCSPITPEKIKAYLADGGDPNAYVNAHWVNCRWICSLPIKYPVVGVLPCLFYAGMCPLVFLCQPCGLCWQGHILLLAATDDTECQIPWWSNVGAVDALLAAGANTNYAAAKGCCAPNGTVWENKGFAGYSNRGATTVRMGAPQEAEMEM